MSSESVSALGQPSETKAIVGSRPPFAGDSGVEQVVDSIGISRSGTEATGNLQLYVSALPGAAGAPPADALQRFGGVNPGIGNRPSPLPICSCICSNIFLDCSR